MLIGERPEPCAAAIDDFLVSVGSCRPEAAADAGTVAVQAPGS